MNDTFREVSSPDGTTIAYDRLGDGLPVVLVCGAMCDRALMRPTAEELAKHFDVFNYDCRGRGDDAEAISNATPTQVPLGQVSNATVDSVRTSSKELLSL